MKKSGKKIIFIVLLAALVLCGLYFALNQKPQNQQETVAQSEEKLEPYTSVDEFNEEVNAIYANVEMSNEEKVEAAQKCAERLLQSDLSVEDKQKSVDVPSHANAVLSPEYSDWTVKSEQNPYPPVYLSYSDKMGLDFEKEIIPIGREDNQAKLPETGYRYGGEGGYNYTCAAKDGHIPTLDERGVPKIYIPEKDREVHFDNEHYFDVIDVLMNYEASSEQALNSINAIIDEINTERKSEIKAMEADELEALHDTYEKLQRSEYDPVREELKIEDVNYFAYGLRGYSDEMTDKHGEIVYDGGCDQFNTALPEYALKRVGVEY